MTRPYFKNSVADLEALFDRSRANEPILKAILHELGFRTTDRAQALRNRVLQAAGTVAKARPADQAQNGPLQPNGDSSGIGARLPEPHGPSPTEPNGCDDEPIIRPSAPEPQAKPKVRRATAYQNKPEEILSAWTALEVLSPQTYRKPSDLTDGDERRIARFDGRLWLPWEGKGEKARKNTQLFYHIMLGAVRMEVATGALLSAFTDSNADRMPASGFAPLASLTVDKLGRPIEEQAVAVSSFAWGLPLALKSDLRGLGRWPEVEQRLADFVDKKIRRAGPDGEPLPLDLKTINGAFDALAIELGLPAPMLEAPAFAIRVYHYFRAVDPPEPPLLGSFFLGDLATARRLVAEGAAPKNLRRFLGLEPPQERRDLIRDKRTLAAAVSPAMTPVGRWPGPGRHPLVLLQQAAVNLAASQPPTESPPGQRAAPRKRQDDSCSRDLVVRSWSRVPKRRSPTSKAAFASLISRHRRACACYHRNACLGRIGR